MDRKCFWKTLSHRANMNKHSLSWTARTWLFWMAFQPMAIQSNTTMSAEQTSAKQTIEQQKASIPNHIIEEARLKQLPLSSVKLVGDSWVACVDRAGSEVCIVLGKQTAATPVSASSPGEQSLNDLRAGDRLIVHKYGQLAYETTVNTTAVHAAPRQTLEVTDVGYLAPAPNGSLTFYPHGNCQARISVYSGGKVRTLDRLPRYQREGERIVRTKDVSLVKEYINSHADEAFVVLVTVPSQCEPCRRMDGILTSGAAAGSSQPDVKTFILEYFAFEDAERELLGPDALFPTTLVFGPAPPTKRMSPSVLYGQSAGVSLEQHTRTVREHFQRGAPLGIARGLLSRESLNRLIGLGRKQP
jgi:hypothetical protein